MTDPPPGTPPARPWHALGADETLSALASAAEGLSGTEAARRRAVHGPNSLPVAPRRSPLRRLVLQFHNLLIHVLLVAAGLAVLVGHAIDALVILAVVLINGAIGFLQEGRAEHALEAIRGMIDPKATVIRAGRRQTVPAEDIVPGDIVRIGAGDRVPADLRLLHASGLRIDEAALTGESLPVEKHPRPVREDAPIGDRASLAFSGTLVAGGQATGVAVATGLASELGRISALVGSVEALKTPLVRRFDAFARQVTAAVLALALLVFVVAILAHGTDPAAALIAVVAIAVAAIPEGLPAVMTITLAIGVQRMAARNAIVRRLPAVETLGAVTVICSDKTGTFTRNEMTVRTIVAGGLEVVVSGVGYRPAGSFQLDGREIDPLAAPDLHALLHAALLCNDAELHESEATHGWTVVGDPMEGALISLAMKAGLDPDLVRRQLPRRDEIPFDAEHRFMATLHHSHDGGAFLYLKGAPERILAMCVRQRMPDGSDAPLDREYWHERTATIASQGQRVIAVATRLMPADAERLFFADAEDGSTLLGLLGLIDPPREEAVRAVDACRAAGIAVKMITGDHAATAAAVARQLGLGDRPRVVSGETLDSKDAAGMLALARLSDVFARTSPEHKLRLVEALQADGAVVAMTGDGVNDAPALKRADIGVAMGGKGTDAAKEAADMVLADDNFASIADAVREGRTVYDNLTKVIAWTLPTSGGEALAIVAAMLLGLTLPVTPVQILWINMVTAVALGLTLAFEPPEPDTMRRPPRPRDVSLLSGRLGWRIAFTSALFVLAAFGVFWWSLDRGAPAETARTLVVNAMVVLEIFYLFSVRYVHGTSLTWRGTLGTPAVLAGVAGIVVGQIAFTYFPPFQAVFDTRAVSWLEGAAVIGLGFVLLAIMEAEKAVHRRLRRSGGGKPSVSDAR